MVAAIFYLLYLETKKKFTITLNPAYRSSVRFIEKFIKAKVYCDILLQVQIQCIIRVCAELQNVGV